MTATLRHLALALLLPLAVVRAQETNAPAAEPANTNAMETAAAGTNAIARASPVIGVFLGAGTVALITSGMDWDDDDRDDTRGALAAPAPLEPTPGAILAGALITFSWNAVDAAASYLIDLATCVAEGGCADFRLEQVSATTYTAEWPAGFNAGRWRVRAVDTNNIAGPWSDYRTFTLAPAGE